MTKQSKIKLFFRHAIFVRVDSRKENTACFGLCYVDELNMRGWNEYLEV